MKIDENEAFSGENIGWFVVILLSHFYTTYDCILKTNLLLNQWLRHFDSLEENLIYLEDLLKISRFSEPDLRALNLVVTLVNPFQWKNCKKELIF